MHFEFSRRELSVKLVYYGPALSGKTTNLSSIHEIVGPDRRGRLMTLETRSDRTLFFDLLPLVVRAGPALSLRIKLFTVPGQVIHNATRKLVLQGADGVAFIADSQRDQTAANIESFRNLRENLLADHRDPDAIPLVIQFNKRDLSSIRPDAEIDSLAARGKEPVFKASAVQGVGVVETLHGLLSLTFSGLDRDHDLFAKLGVDAETLMGQVREQIGRPR